MKKSTKLFKRTVAYLVDSIHFLLGIFYRQFVIGILANTIFPNAQSHSKRLLRQGMRVFNYSFLRLWQKLSKRESVFRGTQPLQWIPIFALVLLLLPSLLSAKTPEHFDPLKKTPVSFPFLNGNVGGGLAIRNLFLAPGDFNASISVSPTAVNAGNSVTYTINYSTGATAANVQGAKITVFLPVPFLNGGMVSFNGTLDVQTSSLNPTVGGYNYDIIFNTPLNAGIQGMMELTVTYPPGTICDGEMITAVANATTNNGPSDSNLSNNSATLTVNDPSMPWTIDVIQDNLRQLGQQSDYRVRVVRQANTVYDLSNATVQLTIPTNAVVNSCAGCSQVLNVLSWPLTTTYTTTTEYAVNLTYNAPDFATGDEVKLSGALAGTNATCNTPVTGMDMVMGNIAPPPPPDPRVACTQPTLSTNIIGRMGTTSVTFKNSGNVALDAFTVTVDFPDEVQITKIPDGLYSSSGINVAVDYMTSSGSGNYNFVTSNSTASGGLMSLTPGGYLTKIIYTFTDPVPAGFMPSAPLVFDYLVSATTVGGVPVDGVNPRNTGSCTVCNDDSPNGNGYSCLEVKIGVVGTYNATPYTSNCSRQAVLSDEAVGPQNIVKGASPLQVYPRDVVTFTLRFNHCGVDDLVGATIVDALPAGFTYVPGSALWQGSAFANPTISMNNLSWTLPTPLAGDQTPNLDNYECTTYTLTFQATVNDMTPASTLTNCFTLNGTIPTNSDAIEICDPAELQDCQNVVILPVGPNNPSKIVGQDLTAPFDALFPEDNLAYRLQWAHLGNFQVKELMVDDVLPLVYTFDPNSVVYSPNIQVLIDAYKATVDPSFNPLTYSVGVGGTTLHWDFKDIVFPGNGATFEIKYNVQIKAGTPPGNIQNCFTIIGTSVDGQGVNVRMDAVEDCDIANVKPVGPVNTQKTLSVTDGTVQPTEELYYTLKFQNSGPFAVNNLKISDILPTYLEFVEDEAIVYTGVPTPTTFTYNAGTGTLSWEWVNVPGAPSGSSLSDVKEIRYKVRVKNGVLAGTVFNNCFRIDGRGTNIDPRRTSSPSSSAENENLTPYLEQVCSSNLTVLTLATVSSRKGIKGECDQDFVYFDPEGAFPPNLTNLNGIGRTIPGGEATYRLQITNPGNIVIKDLVLIDILPFLGDKGVLRFDEDRLTQWKPTLAGPITAPAGVTVSYSLVQNPCRVEFDPDELPSGCNPASWSTIPPADISQVQSIKLDFAPVPGPGGSPGLEIGPAQTFSIDWNMYAPFDAPEDLIAWNSFAFQGVRLDNQNKFLTAEPNKVGLAVKRDPKSQLGNYVWIDRNQDGIQNENPADGVNGIKVTLMKSSDNIKGNGDDAPLGSTFTVNDFSGNPGYYLFPGLDAGRYYVTFDLNTLPPTTAVTTQNANSNSNDDLDSDGDPAMGMTDIVNLGLPDQNLSLDLGLTPPDCILNGTQIVPLCDDNGTPNNPNDDKITLQQITAFKTGAAGGNKYTLIIERKIPNLPTQQLAVYTNLDYGTAYGPYGPFNVGFGEEIQITVIDETNPVCRIIDRVLGCADYGDLPNSYVTTGPNAPRHLVQMDKMLGTCVDTESDGSPNSTAQGDNQDAGSRAEGTCGPNGDEDGIEFLTPLVPGDTACIRVTYISPTTGDPLKLNAFIDFNGDGNFDISAGNPATDDQLDFLVGNTATKNAQLALGGLETILCFIVPANATFVNGDIYARFRLSCDGDLGPDGVNPDGSIPPGEIEDYFLPTAKIGNLVWFDTDIDGTQDASEPGLEGIVVTLVQAGEDKIFDTNDDFVSRVTTDANGVYAFCGVIENDTSMYKILIQTPTNLLPGFANANGVSDVLDSDGQLLVPNVPTVVQTMFLLPDVQDLPVNENGKEDKGNAGVNGYPDNQVDETLDFSFIAIDLGDLPEMAQGEMFPTTLINNGASHTVPNPLLTPGIPYLYLGSTVDVELDGKPTALTNGDDNAGIPDDEDGITVLTPMVPGYEACVEVRSTIPAGVLGYLQGWIDFNGNGKFDGAEQVATNYSLVSGNGVITTLCFVVPQNAVFNDGMAFMRWRLSTQQNLGFTGHALNGEVEDYKENLGKIGNLVWNDNNFNGRQDPFEPGIPNHEVTVQWAGEDGNLATTGDNRSFLTTTDANGEYYVCGLIPGTYKIIVQTPDDMTPTRPNVTTVSDVLDSDGIVMLTPVMDLSMVMETVVITDVTDLPEDEDGLQDDPNMVGTFPDNQTDQTHDFGFAGLDYGDLPEGPQGENFNTTMAETGPVHVLTPTLILGKCADAERDGTPDDDAGVFDGKDGDQGVGDDGRPSKFGVGEACTDDEDGIRFITPLIPGFQACIEVTYTAPAGGAKLQAWIDFNGNGQFELGEYVNFDNNGGDLLVGTNQVVNRCFTVPADAVFNDGTAFVRVRLSPTGVFIPSVNPLDPPIPTPDGPSKFVETTIVPQGEVEDYMVKLAKVGNLVWEDRNWNGQQDDLEEDLGINGVTVALIYAGANGTIEPGTIALLNNPDNASSPLTLTPVGDDRIYYDVTSNYTYKDGSTKPGFYYFCGLIEGTYDVVVLGPKDLTPTRPNLVTNSQDEDKDSDGLETARNLTTQRTLSHSGTFTIDNQKEICERVEGEEGIGDQDLSNLLDVNNVGTFPDKQTDQRFDFGFTPLDFGDLPQETDRPGVKYNTTIAENGPRHIVKPDFFLGMGVDAELDGNPDDEAGSKAYLNDEGDDATNNNPIDPSWKQGMGNDDGDGIRFMTLLVPGYEACIEIKYALPDNFNGPDGYLNAWIDYNGNGVLDAGEKLAWTKLNGAAAPIEPNTGALELEKVYMTQGNGKVVVCFKVPKDAKYFEGDMFARFRLSENPRLGPDGILAPELNYTEGRIPCGEVEDYYMPLSKVGNLVWEDRDYDGIQDINEPVIPKVPIKLEYAGPDGIFGTDDLEYIYHDTTDINGRYYFCGLIGNLDPSGVAKPTYRLIVSDPEGMTATFNNPDPSDDACVKDNSNGDDLLIDDRITRDTFSIMDPMGLCTTEAHPNGINDQTTINGFPDGQYDETRDFGYVGLDYGDLPVAGTSYLTLRDSVSALFANKFGPRHAIQPKLYLGEGVDGELNGQPDADAGSKNGGDDDGQGKFKKGLTTDDESGVRLLSPMIPGELAYIKVTYTSQDTAANAGDPTATGYVNKDAYLRAFIDFNGDGDLNDASDLLTFTAVGASQATLANIAANNNPLMPGGVNQMQVFAFRVPLDAVYRDGTAFMRYRLSWEANVGPDNNAYHTTTSPYVNTALAYPRGEVEDYAVPVAKVGNLSWFDHDVTGDQNENDYLKDLQLVLVWGGVNEADGTFDKVGYQKTMGSDGDVTDVLYNLSIVQPNGAATMPPLSNDVPGQIVKTNAQGLYSFQGLIPGNYYLIPLKYLQANSADFVNAWPKHRVLTLKDNPGVNDQNDSDGMPGALIVLTDGNSRDPEVCIDPQPTNEAGNSDAADATAMNAMHPTGHPFPDASYNQTIDFGWVDEPNIEANLDIVGVNYPTSQICGNFNVIMHMCVKNPQEVPLDSIQMFLNLKDAYGNALFTTTTPKVSIVDSSYVTSPAGVKVKKSQIGAKSQLVPNPDYDGVMDTRLLKPLSENADFLLKGDSIVCIRIEFEIDPTKGSAPWSSQGSVTARAVGFNKATGAKRPLTDYFVKSPRFGKTIVVSDLTDEIDDPMNMIGVNYPQGGDGIAFEGMVADRGFNGTYLAPFSAPNVTGRDKYLDQNDKTIQNDECWIKTKWNSGVKDVNIRLDENCEALVTADLLVPNHTDICGFDKYPEGSYYRVIIIDKKTERTIWSSAWRTPFDATPWLGRELIYEVKSVANHCNALWGKLNFEDKSMPVVTCPVNTYKKLPGGTYTFVCTDIDSIMNVKRSWTDADYAYYTGLATATDNCGNPVLDKVSDVLTVYADCADQAANNYYYAQIARTFYFRDEFGNVGHCTQYIYFKRPTIVLPVCKVEVPANLATGDTELKPIDLVSKKYELYESVPYFYNGAGKKIYLTGKDYCGIAVNYTDQSVFNTGECGRKIIRRWSIIDWCYGTGNAYPNYLIANGDCYNGVTWNNHIYSWDQLIIVGDASAPVVKVKDIDHDKYIGTGYADAPKASPIKDNLAKGYDAGDVIEFSTGPMNCEASFLFTKDHFIVEEASKWSFSIVVLERKPIYDLDKLPTGEYEMKTPLGVKVTGDSEKGYSVTGLPMLKDSSRAYFIQVTVANVCYGSTTILVPIRVVDRIAPVMVCDDKLVITRDNVGTAKVSAADVDEGSSDNCGALIWKKVRRPIGDCEASFRRMPRFVDANGNGKIDPYNPNKLDSLDYIDENGNKRPDELEYFRLNNNGELMSPMLDSIPFFCCDPASVMVELWGQDWMGNRSFCWNNITIEDKTPPVCIAPWEVTVHCDDKNLAFIDSKIASAKAFGDVIISSGNLCLSVDTAYSVTKKLNCGAGIIERIWTITKQTGKGPVSVTCKQIIRVLPLREYNICFPKDADQRDCKKPIVDSATVRELGCDLLAVNVSEKRYDASDDECYKIFRTYTIINWCTYNDACGDPMDPSNLLVVNRSTFENYGKSNLYVLVRDRDYKVKMNVGSDYPQEGRSLPSNTQGIAGAAPYVYSSSGTERAFLRDGDEEFWISADTIVGNASTLNMGDNDNISGNNSKADFLVNRSMPYCTKPSTSLVPIPAENYVHGFMYTQIIKVYDTEAPVVTGKRDTFCTSATACTANITKIVTIKDNCTDQVELEQARLMIAPNQTTDAGLMILYTSARWSTKALGNGQFEITVSGLPEGTHDLIVVGRDECGNLSAATRIPFVVQDCKAPAPICINGLSTELMPDGNGGGMMAVWAKDFVASPIYDCNGQGPETKDGLKVITKYSINRVGEVANPNQTSITFSCADAGKSVLVELHAWDERGNHDFCITFIDIQDNRQVCTPGSGSNFGEISGLITTDDLEPVLGASIEISGGAQMNQNTSTTGGFSFRNLIKGNDFTVAAQMDKEHLNGVSTFDLVLLQKHILGTQALTSPYRLIAADVNNSKTISTLDMIQIRKLILNLDNKFNNVPSWKFVDASYKFANANNPWSDSFPEVVNINDLNGRVKADFIAIKMGDVNGNASATGAVATEIRGGKDMILSTEEQQLNAGQTYTVAIRAQDLSQLQGFQFTLQVGDRAEILGLEYGVMKAEHFGLFQKEGTITTSFHRTSSLADDAVLFTLKLKANATTLLSKVLDINSRMTHEEAYNQNDEVMGVRLSFGHAAIDDRAVLRQNTPNPFADETSIGFYLPRATKAKLTIRDVKGALIYQVEGNYTKGNNQVILKQEQLRASGVMYYTLQTNDFTDTKKMVLLNK